MPLNSKDQLNQKYYVFIEHNGELYAVYAKDAFADLYIPYGEPEAFTKYLDHGMVVRKLQEPDKVVEDRKLEAKGALLHAFLMYGSAEKGYEGWNFNPCDYERVLAVIRDTYKPQISSMKNELGYMSGKRNLEG